MRRICFSQNWNKSDHHTTYQSVCPIHLTFHSKTMKQEWRQDKKVSVFTCVQAFRARVTLLVPLTAPHLHELSMEWVQNVPIHCVHCIGQLQIQHNRTHLSEIAFGSLLTLFVKDPYKILQIYNIYETFLFNLNIIHQAFHCLIALWGEKSMAELTCKFYPLLLKNATVCI